MRFIDIVQSCLFFEGLPIRFSGIVIEDFSHRRNTDVILAAAAKVFGIEGSSPSPPAKKSTVSRRSKLPGQAGVTARADGNPGVSSNDLTGPYYNAGYGTAVLCGVQSSSPSCESVLDASAPLVDLSRRPEFSFCAMFGPFPL